MMRGGPLPGYFQPVEIYGPEGLEVAFASQGQFEAVQAAPMKAGLLLGPVYRLRVTNIPLHPGAEVFPTIEMIDRTYPPPGLAFKFPVPIELSAEDLYLAIDGKLVTRVIYVEDPQAAVPAQSRPGEQRWYDAGPGVNPVALADTLGRPIAILRMGGRLPDNIGADPDFFGPCAPFLKVQPRPAPQPVSPEMVPATPTAGFMPAPDVPGRSGVGLLPVVPEPIYR